MNRREYKNADFSCRFDHLSLMDVTQKKENPKREKPISDSEPITFNSLEDNFIPRMRQQEVITPNRFVWHVTRNYPEGDLLRFRIAKEGLKCIYSEYKVIFANNALISLADFYPLIFDFCFVPDSNIPILKLIKRDMEEPLYHCDYWRIDTHKCIARWHIDPNMEKEELVKESGNYICTTEDIPPHALRLYKITPLLFQDLISEYLDNSTIIPVSLLRSDEKVNNWINRTKKQLNSTRI